MNLINDKWITVKKKDGSVSKIAPWEVTMEDCSITAPAYTRPDFNGGIVQFLIGLIQTTCTPENNRYWRKWYETPPKSEELKGKFQEAASAFNLDGDGPRFMQDLELEKEDNIKKDSISYLLIDMPSDNAKVAHFMKKGQCRELCEECSALGLFSLQTNSPAGGSGYRTGIRGGGPLTTLIIGETLWRTVWLNILERDDFLSKSGNKDKDKPSDKFPWLAPTRVSNPISNDIHPAQNFWAMPRRILLVGEENNSKQACYLCGNVSKYLYTRIRTKNQGINYTGAWSHPLSPYYEKEKEQLPVHPQPGGIGYRHWLGFVQNYDKYYPARVVNTFYERRVEGIRLWAFGYDMESAKARCWYDSTMPLILVDEKFKEQYEDIVKKLVESAEKVSSILKKQIKRAFFPEIAKDKDDLSFITNRFWSETEKGFYDSIYRLKEILIKSEDESLILIDWYKLLRKTAYSIFDDYSQNDMFDVVEPGRISRAWLELKKEINGKKLLAILGLSYEQVSGQTHRDVPIL